MRAPLDEIEELALGFELLELADRDTLVPGRVWVGARGRQVLANVRFLDRLVERVFGDLRGAGLARHVALAVMASDPAALLVEVWHRAVVDQHRHAVLVDRRLLALVGGRRQPRRAVSLPFLAVEAVIGIAVARVAVLRLP